MLCLNVGSGDNTLDGVFVNLFIYLNYLIILKKLKRKIYFCFANFFLINSKIGFLITFPSIPFIQVFNSS